MGIVYEPGEVPDILVRSERLGASMAEALSAPENKSTGTANPDHKVVLMRKHGFTTWGAGANSSIQSAVFRAYFTAVNARVQTNTALVRHAFGGLSGDTSAWETNGQVLMGNFEPLTDEQAAASEVSNAGTIDRPWGLWTAEVESMPLYKNDG